MLSDPLTLKDSTGTDVSFSLVSNVTDPKTGAVTTKRTDASRDPNSPRVLTIKQSITGQGANRVRRTTVQVADTQLSVAGVPYTMTYQGSWVYPLNGEFGTTDLDNAVCIGSDLFLSTASLAVDATKRSALLQGQA
jgi:hypothetical protein